MNDFLLELTKKQLEDVLELSPNAILAIDQNNKVVFASKRAENILGYERSELIGKGYEILIPERHREKHSALCANYLKSPVIREIGHERKDITCLKKDGNEILVEIDLSAAKLSEKKNSYFVISIIRDVTESKKAIEIIHLLLDIYRNISKEKTFNEALQTTLSKVCTNTGWDYGEAWVPSSDRTRLQLSPSHAATEEKFEQFWELSSGTTFLRGEGLPGRVWASKTQEWMTDVSNEPLNVYYRADLALNAGLRAGFGVPIVSDEQVTAVLVFYMVEARKQDKSLTEIIAAVAAQLGSITELKRKEEKVRESEQRFRSVAETATDAIVIIDDSSTVRFVNNAVERIFGYTKELLLGKKLTKLMPPRYRDDHLKALDAYLKSGIKHLDWRTVHMQGLHKNGDEVPLEISYSEFIIGGKHYFNGIIRDITERKKAEQALLEEIQKRADAENALKEKDKAIRKAYVDVFSAVTGGRLVIMTLDEIKEALGVSIMPLRHISKEEELILARKTLKNALEPLLSSEKIENMMIAFSEAITNVVKHAKNGKFQVFKVDSTLQVLITDTGPGIDFSILPKATLLAGFSTKQTLGVGFSLMLELCDRVLLSTQPGNTSLALEVAVNQNNQRGSSH